MFFLSELLKDDNSYPYNLFDVVFLPEGNVARKKMSCHWANILAQPTRRIDKVG